MRNTSLEMPTPPALAKDFEYCSVSIERRIVRVATSDGRVVFVESAADRTDGAGQLVLCLRGERAAENVNSASCPAAAHLVAVADGVGRELSGSRASQIILETVQQFGLEPMTSTPAELTDLLKRDTAKWGPIVKQIGFTADT